MNTPEPIVLRDEERPQVYRAGGEWYFSSRWGEIGPFRTRDRAHLEAAAHARACRPSS
ncbi:MAG: hypothetical protein ACKOBM_04055 [Gammaproteobacteria bacterium]|jgi:hypothetical protein